VLLAGAGCWLPRVARAGTSSISLAGTLAFEADRTRIRLALAVRSTGKEPVEVLAHAVTLVATARGGEAEIALRLESDTRRARSMSRAGHRLGSRLVLPPGDDVPYDHFSAPWPEPIAAEYQQTLTVRALTVPLSERPEAEHPGLRALAALELGATVVRPR
jgi:hypothetical protein